MLGTTASIYVQYVNYIQLLKNNTNAPKLGKCERKITILQRMF
jgi:hypothetical protein